MVRPFTVSLLVALACSIALMPNHALGESAKELVGTWTAVSSESVRPDRTRVHTYGTTRKGF